MAIMLYPLYAQAGTVVYVAPQAPVVHQKAGSLYYSKDAIQQAVASAVAKYGADKAVAFAIVEAETGHYTKFIGDNGTSIGIAQIHLPAHPEVSRAQAENLYFSADFLAKNLAEGHCSMWSTCPLSSG